MSSTFEPVWPVILLYEGSKFTNDPDDAGGATKFGWTLSTLRGFDKTWTIDRLKTMTTDQAKALYAQHYYSAQWTSLPQAVTTSLVMFAIHTSDPGKFRLANTILQRATRAATEQKLIEDGLIGPKTLAILQEANADALSAAVRSEVASYYRQRLSSWQSSAIYGAVGGTNVPKYIEGWLNRAYNNS